MIYTSGDSTDGERPAWRNGGKHNKKRVEDVILTHEDGDEQVADDHVSDLQGIGAFDRVPDEDAKVGNKNYTEDTAVESEHLMAQIA